MEEIKKLTPAEHLVILEEVLALVREELKRRVHTPTPPNGAEAQALAGILLAFRDLDQPLMLTEFDSENVYQYEKK